MRISRRHSSSSDIEHIGVKSIILKSLAGSALFLSSFLWRASAQDVSLDNKTDGTYKTIDRSAKSLYQPAKTVDEKIVSRFRSDNYICPVEKQLLWEYAMGFSGVDSAIAAWDSILDDSRRHIKKFAGGDYLSYAKNSLHTIDSIILSKNFSTGVKYVSLSEAVKHRQLDCFNHSIIYRSIGRELDLPITYSSMPAHIFVRWVVSEGKMKRLLSEYGYQCQSDSEKFDYDKRISFYYINWETTLQDADKRLNDEYYYDDSKISPKAISDGIYLGTLNATECAGVDLERIAYMLVSLNDDPDSNRKIEGHYIPFFGDSTFKALMRSFVNDPGEDQVYHLAENLLFRSLSLNSNHVNAWNMLGFTEFGQKKFLLAIKSFDEALKLDSCCNIALYNKGLALCLRDDFYNGSRYMFDASSKDSTLDDAWRRDVIRHGSDHGILGLKLFSTYIKYHPNDAEVDRMYEDHLKGLIEKNLKIPRDDD